MGGARCMARHSSRFLHWIGAKMQTKMSLDHTEAEKVIHAVKEELLLRKKAAVIAVSDAGGELIALLRLDGAPLPSIVIAANKAWTAARERKPTFDIGQAARDPKSGFDMAYYGDRRYVGWGGGIPVIIEGKAVGAIAVSGLTEQEDAELAKIGLAALKT
jgi:glc operon protein GlcG